MRTALYPQKNIRRGLERLKFAPASHLRPSPLGDFNTQSTNVNSNANVNFNPIIAIDSTLKGLSQTSSAVPMYNDTAQSSTLNGLPTPVSSATGTQLNASATSSSGGLPATNPVTGLPVAGTTTTTGWLDNPNTPKILIGAGLLIALYFMTRNNGGKNESPSLEQKLLR